MHVLPTLWVVGCLSSVSVHEAHRGKLADQDGDGFESVESGGTDCDDDDARVHPDALDAAYDGLDADCAGDDDFDADGDGYRTVLYGGEDCEDFLAVVNPSATEICGDGLDNNCDGGAESCFYTGEYGAEAALVSWTGQTENDRLGEWLSVGESDLAWAGVSIEGRLRLGWVDDVTSNRDELGPGHPRTLVDDVTEDSSGVVDVALEIGDLDGDGSEDLAVALRTENSVGESLLGSVFLFTAQSAGAVSDGVELLITGGAEFHGIEAVVQSTGELHLWVGACEEGTAWRLLDPLGTPVVEDHQEVDLGGRRSGMGCLVEDAGDMDGDGLREVAFAEISERATPEVWILAGSDLDDTSSVVDGEALVTTYASQDVGGAFGASLVGVGDVDGDGFDELAVGAPCETEDNCGGNVYLVHDETDWGPRVYGDGVGFGSLLAGGSDADGDGQADMLVGGAGGETYLFSGRYMVGIQGIEDALARWVVPGIAGVAMTEDWDANGLSEVVLGAPGAAGEAGPGHVFLFAAPGM